LYREPIGYDLRIGKRGDFSEERSGMESTLSIVVPLIMAILLVIVVAYLEYGRGRGRNTPTLDVSRIDWEAALSDEVQMHLPDNANAAVRAYRNITGIGLKDSQDIIAYLLAHPEAAPSKHKNAAAALSDEGIRDLLREGKTEEAIEAYKTFAGVDVFTARDAIAEIEAELQAAEVNTAATVQQRNIQ
jgi:hypothetical protein